MEQALAKIQKEEKSEITGRQVVLRYIQDKYANGDQSFKCTEGQLTGVLKVNDDMKYSILIMVIDVINLLLIGPKCLMRDDIIGPDYQAAEVISAYVHDPETAYVLDSTGALETYGTKGHIGKAIELKRFFSFSDLLGSKSGGTPPQTCLIKRTVGATHDWTSSNLADRKGDL